MNKRLIVLAVLAILIVSAIPVLAEENDSDNTTDVKVTAGSRIRVTAQDIRIDIKGARERLAAHRANVVAVRADLAKARADFLGARSEFAKARAEFAKCSGDECADAKAHVKIEAQTTLLTAADHVLSVLGTMKAKVEASNLSAEEKAEAIAALDARITAVTEARATVANLDENATRAELRDAAQTIRKAWKDARAAIKRHAGQLAWGEMKAVIAASVRMSAKLDTTIARLEEQGADADDIAEINEMKAEFDAKIDEAEAHLAAARDAYAGIDSENVDGKERTVRAELKAAREALREAHVILRDIVKELREVIQETKEGKNEADEDSDDEQEDADEADDDAAEDADDSDDDADDADEAADAEDDNEDEDEESDVEADDDADASVNVTVNGTSVEVNA